MNQVWARPRVCGRTSICRISLMIGGGVFYSPISYSGSAYAAQLRKTKDLLGLIVSPRNDRSSRLIKSLDQTLIRTYGTG